MCSANGHYDHLVGGSKNKNGMLTPVNRRRLHRVVDAIECGGEEYRYDLY